MRAFMITFTVVLLMVVVCAAALPDEIPLYREARRSPSGGQRQQNIQSRQYAGVAEGLNYAPKHHRALSGLHSYGNGRSH